MSGDASLSSALRRWRRADPQRVSPDAPVLWVPIGPARLPVPSPGRLHAHDLHHLILGYDTDLCGEIEVSAFELRTGPPSLYIGALCIAAVMLGLVVAPRRTLAAWRCARGWRSAYGLCLHEVELETARRLLQPSHGCAIG